MYGNSRLAKENIKPFGRLLGKITHSNPLVVLDCVVDAIQSYDNLTQLVVDTFKYLSKLSFDVLGCMSLPNYPLNISPSISLSLSPSLCVYGTHMYVCDDSFGVAAPGIIQAQDEE